MVLVEVVVGLEAVELETGRSQRHVCAWGLAVPLAVMVCELLFVVGDALDRDLARKLRLGEHLDGHADVEPRLANKPHPFGADVCLGDDAKRLTQKRKFRQAAAVAHGHQVGTHDVTLDDLQRS
ncbi:hypothetical protein OGAPHI_001150 [Ogataea philodendri]|uniref:Uncharacterized protein n=1 Tax=Ogataea philodendri TaxID=1378263 RepID=A0A9P8PFF0_9ASCO|nr:uncharacterized protein OGAPHI_001150 [Ogataea philodendri]KAH3670635.1 hypothetical protein OGAPHI_001150 [Ogataea philodendri]